MPVSMIISKLNLPILKTEEPALIMFSPQGEYPDVRCLNDLLP